MQRGWRKLGEGRTERGGTITSQHLADESGVYYLLEQTELPCCAETPRCNGSRVAFNKINSISSSPSLAAIAFYSRRSTLYFTTIFLFFFHGDSLLAARGITICPATPPLFHGLRYYARRRRFTCAS